MTHRCCAARWSVFVPGDQVQVPGKCNGTDIHHQYNSWERRGEVVAAEVDVDKIGNKSVRIYIAVCCHFMFRIGKDKKVKNAIKRDKSRIEEVGETDSLGSY